ncbi:MAG TPA: hypothetical protein VJC06_00535 [Candidatus Paceibacterota bacterium]
MTKINLKRKIGQVSLSMAKVIFLILRELGTITVESFFHNSHARKFGFGHGPRHYHNYYRTVNRLRKSGFIKKENNIYKLTSTGEKEAFFSLIKSGKYFVQKDNTRWDKKWRIIFFDIPEKKRRYRDELRSMLKAIGFKEFQKSIWIYPRKVPEFLKEILFDENIKHYTRLITTSDIEYDKDLRKMFNL